MTDLWSLARNNDVNGLKNLFNKGIGIKAVDEKGLSLLHHAAFGNAVDVIIFLIEKGADIEYRDSNGYTPVLFAASATPPCEEAILTLVAHGANPNVKTEFGISLNSFEFSENFPKKLLAAKQLWVSSQNRNKSGSNTLTVSVGSKIKQPINSNNQYNTSSMVTEEDILRKTSRFRKTQNLDPEDLKLRRSTATAKVFSSTGTINTPSKSIKSSNNSGNNVSKQENFNRMRSTSSVPTYNKISSSTPSSPLNKNSKDSDGNDSKSIPSLLSTAKKKKKEGSKKDKSKKTDKKKDKKEKKSKDKKKKLSKSKSKNDPNLDTIEEDVNNNVSNKLETISSSDDNDVNNNQKIIIPKINIEGVKGDNLNIYQEKGSISPSIKNNDDENETEAINIDAITEVLCKFVKETVNSDLGKPFSDFRPVLEATKELSTTLKQTFDVADVYSNTLDKDKREMLLNINETLKSEVKNLFISIRTPHDLRPLRQTTRKLVEIVHELYVCLESVNYDDTISLMRNVVYKLKQFVLKAKDFKDNELQNESSSLVTCSMELCSLIHDYIFINALSKMNKRSLNEKCCEVVQSIRSLILSVKKVNQDPSNQEYTNGMNSTLNTTAEHIKEITRCLKDEKMLRESPEHLEKFDIGFIKADPKKIESLFNKATAIIANAKSKYMSYTKNELTKEENELLSILTLQSQLFKHISSSLQNENYQLLMGAALITSENVTRISSIILPISDQCKNDLLIQEIVQCLENSIRCAIQLKIICASISVNPSSMDQKEHLAYTILIWAGYLSFLLDAFRRAVY